MRHLMYVTGVPHAGQLVEKAGEVGQLLALSYWPMNTRNRISRDYRGKAHLVDGCPSNASLTIHQLHPLLHGHPIRFEAEGGDTELGFHHTLPSLPHFSPSAITSLLPGWQAHRSPTLPPTHPVPSPCHHVPDQLVEGKTHTRSVVPTPQQSSRDWHYRHGFNRE